MHEESLRGVLVLIFFMAGALVVAATFSVAAETEPPPNDGETPHRAPIALSLMSVVNVTVMTEPPDLEILVDDTRLRSPQTFLWENGSVHALGVVSPQTFGSMRRLFTAWSDGQPAEHYVTVTGPAVFVATFRTEYAVSISTVPPGLDLTIDDVRYPAPFLDWWAEGATHGLSLDPSHFVGEIRYSNATWSNGLPRQHTVTVSGPISLTATYQTYYLLTVESPVGSAESCVSAPCYYPEGARAFFNLTSGPINTAGTRYQFLGWVAEPGNETVYGSVVMDSAKHVTGVWSTQHYLSVESTHGRASPSGWYEAGQNVSISVESIEATAAGQTWRFERWSGSINSTAPQITLLMDGPKTVTANSVDSEPPGYPPGGSTTSSRRS